MLLSHFGMAGQDIENRRLMAETFLRPQTWKYFCDEISSDNCTTPYYDDEGRLIAARPPSDESEDVRYFSAESFHGHFAATADNDCDASPFACTGHISNVQCDWTTYAIPQAHYLGIPVKGNGPGVAGGYCEYLATIWIAHKFHLLIIFSRLTSQLSFHILCKISPPFLMTKYF